MTISLVNPTVHNFNSAFAPDNQMSISAAALASAQTQYPLDSRLLFYHLMHISEHYTVLPVVRNFIEQALVSSTVPKPLLVVDPGLLQIAQLHSKSAQPIHLDIALAKLSHAKSLLIQWAPVVLTAPCCLQNISQVASSDNGMAVDLFAIYLQFTGQKVGQISADNSYQNLLQSYGIDLPGVSTWAFVQQATVDHAMYDLATLQLALGQLPRLYFPEILGFTLAYCQTIDKTGQLASMQLKTRRSTIGKYLIEKQLVAVPQIAKIGKIISCYLQANPQQKLPLWRRIEKGHHLYTQHFQRCLLALYEQHNTPNNAEQKLIKLLQRIAAKATGHHGKIQLQGKSLDIWFTQQLFAGDKLLAALRASNYVDQQQPEQSRLLKLFDFSGPMFGVLNDQERQVLEDWLIAPSSEVKQLNQLKPAQEKSKPVLEFSPLIAISPIQFPRLSNQQLYYYLINAELYPEVYTAARQRAQALLNKIRYTIRLPFRSYQHRLLEQWISHNYSQEMKAYRPFQAPAKVSRESYIWGIEQLAPTVLSDGCWLQGASQLQFYSTRQVGAHLFSIYSDEVGAGKQQQNHPFIYRQLLQSLAIALPPTHSRDFNKHPGFIASAFDIPVYLLTLASFPSQFLPETLGVNLAIELNGLGRMYMSLADELEYWDIDPAIVKVHISIDNVATGHTALATKAIQFYLDDILANQGINSRDQHWRRIYTGYCSLRRVSVRFKYAMLFKFLQKKCGLN